MPRLAQFASTALVVALAMGQAHADVMSFKLLPNYSRATFKSDAPLETFVGNAAGEGVDGTLAVDPAKPQEAKASVKVDMPRCALASKSATWTCAARSTSTAPRSTPTAG